MQTVQLYVPGHLDQDLSVERLARVAAMSERNFARVFARETRVTPAEFVERARVDAARVQLESGAELTDPQGRFGAFFEDMLLEDRYYAEAPLSARAIRG